MSAPTRFSIGTFNGADGADSDFLDDSRVPRRWHPMFGFFSFIHNMAPFMMDVTRH